MLLWRSVAVVRQTCETLVTDHYLTRQMQPVADAILPFVGDDFATLIDRQMGLF